MLANKKLIKAIHGTIRGGNDFAEYKEDLEIKISDLSDELNKIDEEIGRKLEELKEVERSPVKRNIILKPYRDKKKSIERDLKGFKKFLEYADKKFVEIAKYYDDKLVNLYLFIRNTNKNTKFKEVLGLDLDTDLAFRLFKKVKNYKEDVIRLVDSRDTIEKDIHLIETKFHDIINSGYDEDFIEETISKTRKRLVKNALRVLVYNRDNPDEAYERVISLLLEEYLKKSDNKEGATDAEEGKN